MDGSRTVATITQVKARPVISNSSRVIVRSLNIARYTSACDCFPEQATWSSWMSGEFELDRDKPYYRTDAPALGENEMREVLVFRLSTDWQPSGRFAPNSGRTTSRGTCLELIKSNPKTELLNSSRPVQLPSGLPSVVRLPSSPHNLLEFRRASALSRLRRLKIKPRGEVQPLFTDLYDPETNLIIEAKGTVTREAIRMAVGTVSRLQQIY